MKNPNSILKSIRLLIVIVLFSALSCSESRKTSENFNDTSTDNTSKKIFFEHQVAPEFAESL